MKRSRVPVTITIVGRQLPGRACGPHTGVRVGLQVGRRAVELVDGDQHEASWTTRVEVEATDSLPADFYGEAVQGKRGSRFLYLAWIEMTSDGDAMFRRAKLQFDGVPSRTLAAAMSAGVLRAELELTAKDGLPMCASIRPPLIAWSAG